MKLIRRVYRLVAFLVHIVLGVVITLIRLRGVGMKPPSPRQQQIVSWWLRRVGEILGLRIHTHGSRPDITVLGVSNHISWLDIMVLASVLPASFVSKAEVRDWPIIGWLAARSGTLFIERGGKNAATQATEQVTWYLVRGQSVMIFPEGTTSDGHGVRRFHPRLFGAAIHANTPIQPVAIRYPHPTGVNPLVPFLDDETIAKSSWRILGEKSTEVEVSFRQMLPVKHADRTALAKKAHTVIEKAVLQQSPLSREARNE